MDHGYGGHPYGTGPQQFPPPAAAAMHGLSQQFAPGAAPPPFFGGPPPPPAAAMAGFPPYGPSMPYPPAAGPFAPPPAPIQQQVPVPLGFFNPWDPPPHIVPPPTDPELQKRIEKLVEYAAKNGPEFEKMLKEKQKDNPLYAFLFGAEGFAYYRYKLWITVNPHLGGPFMNPPALSALPNANPNFNPLGSLNPPLGPVNPVLNPHNAGLNAPLHSVMPPFYEQPHQIAPQHHQPPYFEPSYQEALPKSFKGLSGPLPADVALELQSVLENLSGTKESIKGAKNWFMQRLPFAPALAEALRERVLALDDDIRQLHVIYLANDILFDRVDELRTVWNTRWDWFHKPIHAVANVLHPLWRSEDQYACNELEEGFMTYVEKWTAGDVEMQRRIEDDLLAFRNHSSHFGRPTAKLRETQLQPVSWWEKYGNCAPTLKRLAIRVLSQDCSSGPCERNWSTWALFHTKKRNRLTTLQLERLVFCNCNLKLLDRLTGSPEPTQVDIDKIDIEKVHDIPDIPQEERDLYTLLYEEAIVPVHNTRSQARQRQEVRSVGRSTSTEAESGPLPSSEGSQETEDSASDSDSDDSPESENSS